MKSKAVLRRKGVSPVDWMIGMILFFSVVTMVFYFSARLSQSKSEFHPPLREEAKRIAEGVTEKMSMTVYRTPLLVDSPNTSTSWPLEVYFKPDSDVDQNSIAIINSNSTPIPSEFIPAENKVYWLGNLSSGPNKFFLTYTKGTNLTAVTWPSDITNDTDTVYTASFETTAYRYGLVSLKRRGAEQLKIPYGVNVSLESGYELIKHGTWARFAFAEGTNFTVYNGSESVYVTGRTKTFVMRINSVLLDEFYSDADGTAYRLNSTSFTESTPYHKTANVIDFYDSSNAGGLAVIGSGMDVYVYNYPDDGFGQINVTGTTNLKIYSHAGNYSEALREKHMFVSTVSPFLGVAKKVTGLYSREFLNITGTEYEALKAQLGIEGMDFRVDILE